MEQRPEAVQPAFCRISAIPVPAPSSTSGSGEELDKESKMLTAGRRDPQGPQTLR